MRRKIIQKKVKYRVLCNKKKKDVVGYEAICGHLSRTTKYLGS